MANGIRIDELDATVLPNRDHVVPAMKDGLTVKLTVGQILDLLGKVIDPDEVGSRALFAALNLSDLDDPGQARENLGATEVGDALFTAASKAAGRSAIDALGPDEVDPWAFQPIGVPIPLSDNLVGVAEPPTDKDYRYVKLTASDAYNTGILIGESVSGSAPLVVATAVIDLSASPLDGETINLINTERRFLRAGAAGTVENDQMQVITGSISGVVNRSIFAAEAGQAFTPTDAVTYGYDTDGPAQSGYQSFSFNSANSPGARAGNETHPKNIGVTYYMRIL